MTPFLELRPVKHKHTSSTQAVQVQTNSFSLEAFPVEEGLCRSEAAPVDVWMCRIEAVPVDVEGACRTVVVQVGEEGTDSTEGVSVAEVMGSTVVDMVAEVTYNTEVDMVVEGKTGKTEVVEGGTRRTEVVTVAEGGTCNTEVVTVAEGGICHTEGVMKVVVEISRTEVAMEVGVETFNTEDQVVEETSSAEAVLLGDMCGKQIQPPDEGHTLGSKSVPLAERVPNKAESVPQVFGGTCWFCNRCSLHGRVICWIENEPRYYLTIAFLHNAAILSTDRMLLAQIVVTQEGVLYGLHAAEFEVRYRDYPARVDWVTGKVLQPELDVPAELAQRMHVVFCGSFILGNNMVSETYSRSDELLKSDMASSVMLPFPPIRSPSDHLQRSETFMPSSSGD